MDNWAREKKTVNRHGEVRREGDEGDSASCGWQEVGAPGEGVEERRLKKE